MNRRTRRILAASALAAAAILVASACDTSAPSSQQQSQGLTNDYTNAATSQVPYPLSDMKQGGWTERRLLAEHLRRQNNPKGLRWIVLLTQQGQVVAQWPIQGMVFDPNSQMTTSQLISGCTGNQCGPAVTNAAGDNGTWGPEAGSAAFFTTSGVEVQLPASAIWVESDSPLNITDKPLITYDINGKPSTTYGGLPNGK